MIKVKERQELEEKSWLNLKQNFYLPMSKQIYLDRSKC